MPSGECTPDELPILKSIVWQLPGRRAALLTAKDGSLQGAKKETFATKEAALRVDRKRREKANA